MYLKGNVDKESGTTNKIIIMLSTFIEIILFSLTSDAENYDILLLYIEYNLNKSMS